MTTRLVVAAAVVDSLAVPTRLLAARRTEPPTWAGFWEFPGGKVERGETPEQGLHRELAEELGVAVRLGVELLDGRPDGACVQDPDHGTVWPLGGGMVFRLWAAEVVEQLVPGAPVPLEDHDQLRWLTADELGSVPWLPSDEAAVARCDLLLRQNGST